MWKKELSKNQENTETVGSKEEWYSKALDYWKGVKNDYNGVLGGLAHISGYDISESTKTLNILKNRYAMGTGRCLDCGAGVGRITKDLHTEFFDKTDLLEPEEGFITKAKVKKCPNYKQNLAGNTDKIGEFYQLGMQEMKFEYNYDCIWI